MRHRPLQYICTRCQRRLTTASKSAASKSPQKPAQPSSQPQLAAKKPAKNPFSTRTTSIVPSAAQLQHADAFFQHSKRRFLLSTPKFQSLPPTSVPEVCFIGRSNVGKSSLLNAVFAHAAADGRDELAKTSKHAGRTRAMVAFACGSVRQVNPGNDGGFERWESGMGGGLVVVDTPGYGHSSREEWGREVMKYLKGRQQLRRTYVLVDAEHGLKDTDRFMIALLAGAGVSHQIVLTKFDKLLWSRQSKTRAEPAAKNIEEAEAQVRRTLAEARKSGRSLLTPEILACSAGTVYPLGSGKKGGVAELRHAILEITGLAKGWSEDIKPSADTADTPVEVLQDGLLEENAAPA